MSNTNAAASVGTGATTGQTQSQSDQEWKTLSKEWRGALTTLLNSLDAVNKSRYEVERQKELIRKALTQGKFDVIQRERALELYKQWNQGIQMIPLYPEDFVQQPPSISVPQEPVSGYLYEFDEGLLAAQRRDWIQVAPPPLLPTATTATTVANHAVKVIAPPSPTDPVYTNVGIADWRVRALAPDETISFDDAEGIPATNPPSVTKSNSKKGSDPEAEDNLASAIANAATRQIGARLGVVVTPSVTATATQIPLPYLVPTSVTVGTPEGLVPGGIIYAGGAGATETPPWRAEQQKRQIASQYQRVYHSQELNATHNPYNQLHL